MNKRHSQLFALAILIGAPLLVSLVTNAIPALHDLVPVAPPAQAAAPPEYLQPPVDPSASLPKPLAPPLPNQPQQGDTAFSAAPTLDPVGTAVSGIDPTSGGDPAASAPTMSLPSDGAPDQQQAPQPST